jgi:ketosteroid isomerase-like protein
MPTPPDAAIHPHAQLIERFYGAFAQKDWAAMAACYHPEVHFTDPVFDLRGPRAGQMWRMLCTQGKDLQLSHGAVRADAVQGAAHWEARYTFSKTGRPVHNVIEARFEFRDGLIHRHVDAFDFWRWSRQALGMPGVLLGWSGFLRNKVKQQAARSLEVFAARIR